MNRRAGGSFVALKVPRQGAVRELSCDLIAKDLGIWGWQHPHPAQRKVLCLLSLR